MIIHKLKIDSFGKFKDKVIELQDGINIVCGANESGKTTIKEFILAMLFGMSKSKGRKHDGCYEIYEPWDTASYYHGDMEFSVSGRRFKIARNLYHKETESKLVCLDDGEVMSVDQGDMKVLLDGIGETLYRNSFCIGQATLELGGGLGEEIASFFDSFGNHPEEIRSSIAVKKLMADRKKSERKLEEVAKHRQTELMEMQKELDVHRNDMNKLEDEIMREDSGERKNVFVICFAPLVIGGVCIAIKQPILAMGFTLLGILTIVFGLYKKSKYRLQLQAKQNMLKELLDEKNTICQGLEADMEDLLKESEYERQLGVEIKAMEAAINKIKELSERANELNIKALRRKMNTNIREMSDGKYDRVELDTNFKPCLVCESSYLEIENISKGAGDMVLLAERIALGEELVRDEYLPLILDETFAFFDDVRMKNALKLLSKKEGQIILFSCTDREKNCLDAMGIKYNRVTI